MPHTLQKLTNQSPQTSSGSLRQLFIRWLGIYITITAALLALWPWLAALPLPLTTLLLTAALVPLTGYIVFPLLAYASAGWVNLPAPRGAAGRRTLLITWLVTYPLITLVLGTVLALSARSWPLPLTTLVVTLLAVPLQGLVLLPRIMPRAASWIQGGSLPQAKATSSDQQ